MIWKVKLITSLLGLKPSSVSPFPKPRWASQVSTSWCSSFFSQFLWLSRDTKSLSFPQTPYHTPAFSHAIVHAWDAFPFFSLPLQSKRALLLPGRHYCRNVLVTVLLLSRRKLLDLGLEKQGVCLSSASHQQHDLGQKTPAWEIKGPSILQGSHMSRTAWKRASQTGRTLESPGGILTTTPKPPVLSLTPDWLYLSLWRLWTRHQYFFKVVKKF